MGIDASEERRRLFESAASFAFVLVLLWFVSDTLVTRYYFLHQDRYVGLVYAAALGVLVLRPLRAQREIPAPSQLVIWQLAAIMILALWFGSHELMLDYPITRDELMARFDTEIVASGRFAMPVAEEWRRFSTALIPNFLEPVQGYQLWLSSYMPGHAMLRAGLGMVADQALLNPALAGIGLIALAAIARKIFPDHGGAQLVVVGGYVLSAQVLMNAMTSYAMTAQLAANCLWLWLFLKDRWWSHAIAMMIAVAAIGLHQIIFHPLFAGPILLTLLAKRRFALFGVYALVYATALLCWIGYHNFATGGVGVQGGEVGGASEFLMRRALPLLTSFDSYTVPLFLYNLLRFLSWMPLFLMPLILLAVPIVHSRKGLALPLFASLALSVIAMAWLQPYQGHGWGYRYLHGVIPCALLLAGMGYVRWADADRPRAQGFVVMSLAVTLPVLVFLAITARAFILPYAALSERVDRQTADFVVIDTNPPGSAIDQVRNRPDLSNRPLVLSAELLNTDMVRELCEKGTIVVMTKADYDLPKYGDRRPVNPYLAEYMRYLNGADCLRALQP